MNRTLSTAVLSVATAGALVLAGCSSSGGDSAAGSTSSATASVTGTPASGPHNAADVSFATDMIPHHAQAVEMADMALKQASSTEVKTLATQIKSAQDPEIATMSGWLAGWGEDVPSSSMSMGSMDHSMGSGTGMMSDADMTSLGAASGAAFDKMWVSMMIEHHTGALDMAKTELSDGQNPDAQKLAQSIVASQTAEIATMKQLQTTLPSA